MMVRPKLTRNGALPVKSHQAGGVPGPMPRRGPPLATGGHLSPSRGARSRGSRGKATGQEQQQKRTLSILQWNAEGVQHKKLPLMQRLYAQDIDIACIQETHLTSNLRFSIRGYETYRMDREDRHKGGVLILVKNNILASPFKIETNSEAEIHGVKFNIQNQEITVYNFYCPDNRDLCLHKLDTPSEHCIIIGDFNSHSTSWGYQETDTRGEVVEDWQIDSRLVLLNDAEDPPTFYSRRWKTTSTPDLAFATDSIAKITAREVLEQLGGSDHRPVKLLVDLDLKPEQQKCFPRWNYKKAEWTKFQSLTDQYTKCIKERDQNVNRAVANYTSAILRAAKETIPRGARKNYRPYWTQELQDREDEVSNARHKVENHPTVDNNIAFKASNAKYRKAYKEAARASWKEKTEKLNLDRDGKKLWKLAKAMNDENMRTTPTIIAEDSKILTRKQAADHFMNSYEEVSNILIPDERKQDVHNQLKEIERQEEEEENMTEPFVEVELENALSNLSKYKSPGPDKVTNEMLQNLGTKAKGKLLGLFNNSWTTGKVPQIWREADMVPVYKKGKDKTKASSYRPISLTSCIGKLMERMINARLMWHLEKNKLISPEQAGFRAHRSTEDQVTYISQKIEDAFQDKKHTLAVWIDMEKAFDKVWNDGLRLKLKQNKVKGHMYQWISQYLNNRKARVHVDGAYSRKKTLRQGVPQGGVLSPTLFLIYINDILKELPHNVHAAMYADDLAIWASEEYITTANYRMQEALKKLENWTTKWLVKINETKTTYTVFSLSTKEQKVNLKINNQSLPLDSTPTYLGVTFDRRLTWKTQSENAEKRAKSRLNLMKKITSTTWGADSRTLKTLYTGRVRPAMEYGISTWGTTAKSHFNKISKVQNQATRIISGAMKTTPIQQLETITGLEPIEQRYQTKVMVQSAKFKRLPDHPMNPRMSQLNKQRLKRESFLRQTRALEKENDIDKQVPQDISGPLNTPPWKQKSPASIQLNVPGIESKQQQTEANRKLYTLEHLDSQYPADSWTRVYTDGSADRAVQNGGAGVYIQYTNGETEKNSSATGTYSTNFRAETEAIRTAVSCLLKNSNTSGNIVLLSDALSVLQALSSKDTDLLDLSDSLDLLTQSHVVVLQWIPAHCGVPGNETADKLAKEGAGKEQCDHPVSYKEAKTIIKHTQKEKWKQQHPQYNKTDPYYQLSRSEQVIIFRLRTNHNRLNFHLYTKLKIGNTGQCLCQTGNMTAEHILQDCPTYSRLRNHYWPEDNHTTLDQKLRGSLRDLRWTAAFLRDTGLTI